MTPDYNSPTPNTKQHNDDKTWLRLLVLDTLSGLACYAVFATIFGAVYVGIFGFGLGHMIHWALADTLAIPISLETCFYWGLIPVLNILGFVVSAYILMWKFLLFIVWKVFLWLLSVLPGFLDAWAKNIQR